MALASIPAAACGSRAAPAPLAHTVEAPRSVAQTLIAARADGLHEITADGRDVRRLSATPAQQPRWQVPGRRLVFLTADAAELRSLDLRTMKEQVVARVRTRLDCPGGYRPAGSAPGVALEINDDDHFFVQPARACIRLTDRNPRMADHILDVHVDLATGRTAEYVAAAGDTCKLPRRQAPPCAPEPEAFPEIRGDVEHAGPPSFHASSASPTGRWVVLRGNFVPGDTFFDQVVLHDLATRRTFPLNGELVPRGDAWPAPLTAAQLDASVLGPLLDPTTYETPVYWLPGPDDRLVLGEHLVVPGVRIVQVGQLARAP